MNIVIIGVGYVGLVTGIGLAKFHHNISFLDIDSKKINKLKDRKPPFFEPNLKKYLNDDEIIAKTEFFSEYKNIDWENIDVVMICVQTPNSENNEVDLSYLFDVFDTISDFVNEKSIICIKSTIHPQALQRVIDSSKFSRDELVFNPEFLREGTAFNDFYNPDRIVIGSNHEINRKKIASIYEKIDTEFIFTDPISSQLIKYLSNAYLPLRLSFVNEASQIINELGGNLKETLLGVGLDQRIGTQYFRPSPGWGGSCFPKDVTEINSISKSQHLKIPLIGNINESNKEHQAWFTNYLINLRKEKNLKNIFLLGLSFKENTDDTRHSPTIVIFDNLKAQNEKVNIFDLSFENYNDISIEHEFKEDSLIVEMFPIDQETHSTIKNKLDKFNNFYYLRFWE